MMSQARVVSEYSPSKCIKKNFLALLTITRVEFVPLKKQSKMNSFPNITFSCDYGFYYEGFLWFGTGKREQSLTVKVILQVVTRH